VPFRARVAATGAPVTARWAPGPPGVIPLALVVVPAGADPLARFSWTFRPVLTEIRAWPPGGGGAPDLVALAPLALVTLLSCALVLLAGRPFLG
jgi:hypothetical protein